MTLTDLETKYSNCTACQLSTSRTQVVFGRGSPSPDIVIVGEAPGFEEDVQGVPFVGDSGKLLQLVLDDLNITNYYILNTVLCRPPQNRPPLVEEIKACSRRLDEQLETLKPKCIVTVGSPAALRVVGVTNLVSRKMYEIVKTKDLRYENIPVICTYHPSYILRTGGVKSKHMAIFVSAFVEAVSVVKGAIHGRR